MEKEEEPNEFEKSMQVVQKIQETFNITVPARVITGLNRFVGLPNGIIEGNTNIRDFT